MSLHPPWTSRRYGDEDAIIRASGNADAADLNDRPVACIGLVRRDLTGIGSQVQQPLACVIVGGMLPVADLQPAA